MTAPSSQSTLSNLIRFVVALLAIIIGTSQGRSDLGAFIAFLMIAMHFRTHPTLLAEYKTIMVTLVIAGLWEFFLVRAQILRYEGNVSFSDVPMWVITLWAALATTFNGCLSWGKSHLISLSLIAGLSGPLLAYTGSSLEILHIQNHWQGYLIIAMGWAILAPLLFFLSDYFFKTSEAIQRN